MPSFRTFIIGLAGLAAAAGAIAEEPRPAAATAQETASAPAAVGGLIYVLAGEETAADDLLAVLHFDSTLREALRTDSEGLVEEPSPGGGTLVDLRGRFQNVLVARVGADGLVRSEHVATPPSQPVPDAQPRVRSSAQDLVEGERP